MKAPYSWLVKALSEDNPGFSTSPKKLSETLVRLGFEVEDLSEPKLVGPVVVGRVLDIEELTGFKKPIRFCQVDVGAAFAGEGGAPRGIVCGATNFAPGDLVVAALPGAVLPGDFAIASRKTYGRVSDGMICSVAELGFGGDHSGILVLPEGTAEPGADAVLALGLADPVFDLDVTPDRGYALSVRGLARELAIGLGAQHTDLALRVAQPSSVPPVGEGWPIAVAPGTPLAGYSVLEVRGIDPAAPSPWWIRALLAKTGIRSLGLVVDVTNLVMVELGQPLHAFDADKLSGPVQVREAREGETITTLDGSLRTLDAKDVVIADDSGPVALAGVMGGESTEVSSATTRVLLEAASFDPSRTTHTSRRLGLVSEASRRFERGVDPLVAPVALARAAQLIVSIAGGEVAPVRSEVLRKHEPRPIIMPTDLPDRTAGLTYPPGTTYRRLVQLGCTVWGERELVVFPPSWRSDLKQKADLVEEVLRLEGIDRIPSILPKATAGKGLLPSQRLRRKVGSALAEEGFLQVPVSPFFSSAVFDDWNLSEKAGRRRTVRLANPQDSAKPELATTLMPGLLDVMARNLSRGMTDLAVFSIAQVVGTALKPAAIPPIRTDRPPSVTELRALSERVPVQPVHLAVALCGNRIPPGPWGKGRAVEPSDIFMVGDILARAARVKLTRKTAHHVPWHPGRCAYLQAGPWTVGIAGELHPAVLEKAGLPPGTCVLELNLSALGSEGFEEQRKPIPPISTYPPVRQDIAVTVAKGVPASSVERALRDGAGDLLEGIRLFDVYSGPQVGEGRKSLAYALTFRAADRTLTEDDASEARASALAEAAKRCGAELRA
ncbi:phenylalanine--tRNA ligase subunit beta [Segniliparus rugosus]|uniref:Phenylalanine--tRNA ligase beta subunit n=1 Tax=Segniliparus rugosus (strain ATCC BAA-974 / DSM 45345 / CCUG 50838 / CIP 108380 / JCM 13579 / CDC 945) TaxID=679197 RepID=E5XNT5_SEGRC|nr:phenylalanine--tRNA ligase subunit beta [Segniliparus rugosus]EFV13990.1 phenylalanine-tRNA ligase, beta subunit [Segniliparus rugosus ATCC BAA-974]